MKGDMIKSGVPIREERKHRYEARAEELGEKGGIIRRGKDGRRNKQRWKRQGI